MSNTMKLTRFELFVEGEAQDIGFLVGLDDTTMSKDLKDSLVYNLDKKMTIPDISLYKKDDNVVSFFKKEGLEVFKEDIDKLIEEIDYDGVFSVGRVEILVDSENLIYEDDYQVLLSIPRITSLSYSVKGVNSGIYKFEVSKDNLLFEQHHLTIMECDFDESRAIKIYPDVFDDNFYYYVDFDNSLIKVINNQ